MFKCSLVNLVSTLCFEATRPVRDLKAFPKDNRLWVEWSAPREPVSKYILEWCVLSDKAPCVPDWQQEDGHVHRTPLTGTADPQAAPPPALGREGGPGGGQSSAQPGVRFPGHSAPWTVLCGQRAPCVCHPEPFAHMGAHSAARRREAKVAWPC